MHRTSPSGSALAQSPSGAVSSVLDPVLIRNGDWNELTKRAQEFIAAVRDAR